MDYRAVLLDICQVRGDFDRYILLWEEGAHHPMEYLGAVQTLREAGRPADALRLLERVPQLFPDYSGPMLAEVHLDLLDELGRGDEIPAAWAYFRARPASDTLELVLSHVPEGERQAAREQALGHLLTYGELSQAIESFLREGEASSLAQALEGRREELFDLDSSLLEELAGAPPADHLDLAATIYRKVAMDILEGGSSVAYHRAAACLGQVKKLLCGAERAAEWSKLRDEVRAAHHRKRQFMKVFERL